MKRGSIYWVNLEPSAPPEFGKIRPGLVVSNSEQNLVLPTVVVIPLSTQAPEIWPLRLKLVLERGKGSFAVIPGIRQVRKERLKTVMEILSPSMMERIDEALALYLAD